ncbi:MAG: S1/P1 Nuclease [Caulobacteraceae bacterium]|nr:S1/P1 Nuclease [Caulobacteraceae bacterium]
MNRSLFAVLIALGLGVGGPAFAWGDLGHEVTALIAYRHLTPAARAKLDVLLASDPDPLTAPDFASRATWADKYREGHRETAAWHFVDIEIDHPDLAAACFGFPALPAGVPASAGPARDCVVDKIEEFETELGAPSTSQAERLLALKFLIHFVGDLHQPLHAADHEDRGGNCIGLAPAPDGRAANLHAWWDTGVVETLGGSAQAIAARLEAQISPAEVRAWSQGGPRQWAMDTFRVGARDAYALRSWPTCGEHGAVALSAAYQATAQRDAAIQLEKAGVRTAALLNRALR